MSKMVITLPNGRQVGLGVYVKAWKALLEANPKELIKGFNYEARPAAEILTEMRYGLMDRINLKDPAYGRGRKWSSDWEREALQAAWRLNTPRLVIDWLPAWLKPRFGARLRSACE